MYELDCPICLNSFAFEHIRSLPCGHTYCSSCIEKLTNDAPTCPECRDEFEPDDVRRVFIKPSASNNSSGSQTTSTRESPGDQEAFIKQAKHIARRLRKIDAKTPAQSVENAANVIEQVATIQCKEAQEIVWEAVREFWLRLVEDFEELNERDDLREKLSNLERYLDWINETGSRLRLQMEDHGSRIQHFSDKLEDQTQEIVKLTAALRNAEGEVEQERECNDVLSARLRASDMKHRAEIKQLKKELKSRRVTRPQIEEESLIIEPGEAYNEARSHRLHEYNESSPQPKRRKLSPEIIASADGSSNNDLSDRCPSKIASSPPEMLVQSRERTGTAHKPVRTESDLAQSPPQRPKFGSDWNIRQRRKMTPGSNTMALPFPLDAQGRPKGLLKYGSRVRVKKAK